ncbi:ABC transporter substrate-binding protein [Actinomadura sp. 7K507]|uniref:ABC transporter substrate-binding protein n=1 Tax=Actinomadura sp. 7K507 TaxID=2530365 RepID=UPI00104A7A40|nr:ABC transporter substrate-binding protein [Actinomadura sp. 7K507]TDC98360.1 ABC transporter substrate-binding protein [Actinomadura sp. 7K507]
MRIRSSGRRLRPRALTAVAATAALLATGSCGGSGGESSTGTKTLTLAIQGAPNSFDPAQLMSGTQAYVWGAVFDTLLVVDDKGELQPNAAESWSYSDDRKTLTLKLRDGMTFSTGASVTSAAVKATLERTMSTPSPNQFKLSAVKSVEAPDERTVVLGLKEPDGALLHSLAMAVGVIGDPKTLDAERTALNPVGSGPYVLDESTVNDSTYVLKKRDDHWNADAYPFETFKIRVIKDRTATVNALRSGELNAASVQAEHVDRLESAGFEVKFIDAVAVGALALADRDGEGLKPMSDVRVRRAINMAFDHDKILKQLLRGAGKTTQQMFSPKGTAHDPALDKTYTYDPAAAKKLLAEAGHPDGFSVHMPSLFYTKPFEPTISQSLAEIGIKVTWDPTPPQNSASAVTSKKYGMFLHVEGLGATPVEVKNSVDPEGPRNVFGTRDPELTELVDQANAAQDPAKAAELYKRINAFTVENAWFAPIFYSGRHWATADGVEFLGDGSNVFSSVRTFGLSG